MDNIINLYLRCVCRRRPDTSPDLIDDEIDNMLLEEKQYEFDLEHDDDDDTNNYF